MCSDSVLLSAQCNMRPGNAHSTAIFEIRTNLTIPACLNVNVKPGTFCIKSLTSLRCVQISTISFTVCKETPALAKPSQDFDIYLTFRNT